MLYNPQLFIGEYVGGGTAGYLPYLGLGGKLAQSSNFQVDYTNGYLGLGGTPQYRFHILGTTSSHIGRTDTGFDFYQVTPPDSNAFPVPTVLATAGNINVGTHFYHISYVTALGETSLNPGISPNGDYTWSAITDAAHAQVQLTLPTSTDYRVTHIKIYRSVTGAFWYNDVKLVGTVTNGTTTFIDNVADANRTGTDSYARPNTTNRLLTINNQRALFVASNSTFFGYRSGEGILNNTNSGGDNTFFGALIGLSVNGSKNVAIGEGINVGSSNDTIFIGWSAGGVGAYYQGCTIIGRNAAFWCTAGYGSVVIGGMKGTSYYTTQYNVCLGYEALSSITTGAGNLVVVGTSAAQSLTTSVGSIVIGNFVNVPSATTNGQLNIGNVIYGLGMYSTSVSSSTPTTTAQIGIGIVPIGDARFAIAAGTTAYAAIKLTAGVNRTTPLAGGIEYNGTSLFFTPGATRLRAVLTDNTIPAVGQLPIGDGVNYTNATLSAGNNVSITNAAGSITIAALNGLTWQQSGSVSMVKTNGYINTGGALVTFTLPATAGVGDTFAVGGLGAGGWTIAQNAGQVIRFNSTSTTVGAGGSLSSTNQYDSVVLVCINANTDFIVMSSSGNLTVV